MTATLTLAREIEDAIEAYWNAAYRQGLDHRETDDLEGSAQKAEDDLRQAIVQEIAHIGR